MKPEEMVVLDRWAVGCAKAAQEDILKAMNLEEGATAKDRNAQIGGHKA